MKKVLVGVFLCLAAVSALRAAEDGELPIRKVVLYKNGVGYFERQGRVAPNQPVRLAFKADQMSDVLKSLTVIDRGGGKVSAVNYDASESSERLLARFPFQLAPGADIGMLLDQLKGAQVRLTAGTNTVEGAVIGTRKIQLDEHREVTQATLLLANGELKNVLLSDVGSVKLLDPNLQEDLRRYLEILSSGRRRDLRTLTLTSTGARDLIVNYLVEAPVWKMSYRLILDDGNQGFLQGWALVDNTSEDDWENVQLTLVAGRPISFIQDLYRPLYTQRPRVAVGPGRLAGPVLHEGIVGRQLRNVPVEELARGPAAIPQSLRRREVAKMARSDFEVADALQANERNEYLRASMAVSAQGGELGELFEYRIGTPVNLSRNQSMMIPILQNRVKTERISVFNRSWATQHPWNAVSLENTGSLTLDGGPITVVDAGSYAGEALIETLKPGEKRVVSYAVDLSCRIGTKTEAHRGPVVSAKVERGNLITSYKMVEGLTYTIRNLDSDPKIVFIEHPIRQGWNLAGKLKATETTPNLYRFRVEVPANATKKFAVEEEYPIRETISINNLDSNRISILLSQQVVDASLKRTLQRLAGLKDELNQLTRRITSKQEEVNEIFRDQDRIRRSLQTVRGIPGQAAQLQMWLNKLNAQEGQLEALREDIAQTKQRREEAQRQIDELLMGLSLES